MSTGRRFVADIEADRDRLQELKGTLAHWAQIVREYAQETRDPYSFVTYKSLEYALDSAQHTTEQAIALVLEEKDAGMVERLAQFHRELCSQSTIFGSPC